MKHGKEAIPKELAVSQAEAFTFSIASGIILGPATYSRPKGSSLRMRPLSQMHKNSRNQTNHVEKPAGGRRMVSLGLNHMKQEP